MEKNQYKVLNASQKKKLFAQADTSLNPKEFVLLQKEKKIYIATSVAAKVFMEALEFSIGTGISSYEGILKVITNECCHIFNELVSTNRKSGI